MLHFIFIGIMIWIGIAIAPTVVVLVLMAVPFVLGAIVGGTLLGLITQSGEGVLIGGVIGGIIPYVLINRS